ncbi:hypothetical protein ACB087_10170 (plasmid) [Vibrio sp. VNB-15]
MSRLQSFEKYYEDISLKIGQARTLEVLVVYRKRKSVGNRGLSYKVLNGYLAKHKYNRKQPTAQNLDGSESQP